MAEGNIDRVRGSVEALNGDDLEGFLSYAHEDAEFVTRLSALDPGGLETGHEAMRTWWDNLHRIFPDFRTQLESVEEMGPVTITQVRQMGTGIGTEATTEQRIWIVARWRAGKADWIQVYGDQDEAMEAARTL